jgi:Phosphotransferase enzyme family
MPPAWLPRILRPDFSWPITISPSIAHTTPPIPRISHRIIRRIWGFAHRVLQRFSELYCSWFDIPIGPCIFDLPFGLVLKWSERVGIEEAVAMQMARAAGMPVPKLICYGEHSQSPFPFSILMTRLPGFELENETDETMFEAWEEGSWVHDLTRCLEAMRSWQSPYGEHRICSPIGTSLRSSRVPSHVMGPFETEQEMHEYLFSTASSHAFQSKEVFQMTLASAKAIQSMHHRVVFTHGDLKHFNILIDGDGNLSGILEWGSAGWYPEYWEFSTSMRYGQRSFWYYLSSKLGAERYLAEFACDKDLNRLTVDSYVGC